MLSQIRSVSTYLNPVHILDVTAANASDGGRTSMPNSKKYNRVQLVYNETHKPYLYGALHFVHGDVENQWWERPFVISKRRADKPEIVYGTVLRLLDKILVPLTRLGQFQARTRARLDAEKIQLLAGTTLPDSPVADAIHDEQEDLIEDIFVATCVYVRILAELFPNHMQKYKVPVYNYDGRRETTITLQSISNVLQHHRHLIVRNEYIVDLVSAKDYVISGKPQMGLKISFLEYVDKLEQAVHSVTVKDLVGILRGMTKRISAESSPKDIVFLMQNLYTLGGAAVAPGGNVSGPLETVLNNVAMKTLNRRRRRNRTMRMAVTFTTPRFYLEPDLTNKQIRTEVKVNSVQKKYVTDYESFFAEIVKAYGDRKLYGIPK